MPAIRSTTIAGSLLALALAACSGQPVVSDYYRPVSAYGNHVDYGRVASIDVVRAVSGGTSGAGAMVGGVFGGVLGHQMGKGRGNDAATVAGALGGAVVGNEIERQNQSVREVYRITVQLDRGSYRAFDQEFVGDLHVGDRVFIENGRISHY
jgi:outer membrane lipoprotein SlyB